MVAVAAVVVAVAAMVVSAAAVVLVVAAVVVAVAAMVVVVAAVHCKQVDFEKMSRHHIQWLLACNLLSYFVCNFKNVAEGYIHAKDANMGGAVQSL